MPCFVTLGAYHLRWTSSAGHWGRSEECGIGRSGGGVRCALTTKPEALHLEIRMRKYQ